MLFRSGRDRTATTEHGVGQNAVSFEHDFAPMKHHHRQAQTVRGIGGEQFVGDARDRFLHEDHRIEIGSNDLFRSEVTTVTTGVWDGIIGHAGLPLVLQLP